MLSRLGSICFFPFSKSSVLRNNAISNETYRFRKFAGFAGNCLLATLAMNGKVRNERLDDCFLSTSLLNKSERGDYGAPFPFVAHPLTQRAFAKICTRQL